MQCEGCGQHYPDSESGKHKCDESLIARIEAARKGVGTAMENGSFTARRPTLYESLLLMEAIEKGVDFEFRR